MEKVKARRGRPKKVIPGMSHTIIENLGNDNFCENLNPVVQSNPRERKSFQGSRAFRCYLGHTTYWMPFPEWQESDGIKCLFCNAKATIYKPSPEDMCLCGDQFRVHKPHCLKCGVMTDGEREENEPRCAKFMLQN